MYFIIGYRRKNLLSTALLLTAGLFVSSCHDEISNPDTQAEIRVETDLWHIMPGSRAATVDNAADLQGCDLRIDAYMNGTTTSIIENAKLVYDTDAWRFDDGSGNTVHYYWPIEGSVYAGNTVSSLDFVGYCPNATPAYVSSLTYAAGGSLSFVCDLSSYMTSAAQSGLTEFLWAYTGNQTKDTNSGTVNLTFRHPFARVKFVITAESGTNVKINSIGIAGLKTSGTCSYDGSTTTWDSYGGNTAMSLTQELEIGGTTETDPFLVIPNDYGTKTLTVNATWDDWSDVTTDVSASVNFNWAAGYSYTYNLTLTKYALKVDTEKFTEQW
ncbi:MAG: fimbrillin family protein [Bacteroidales bacterium]|nr:fimbrillin family protein [Bacteroidales bacterium]